MSHPLPPYALAAPVFRFRHLASLAGRAQIGGAREVALACFVAARLASESAAPSDEGAAARIGRCAAAKSWFGTLTLPSAIRVVVVRCAETSALTVPSDMGRDIASLGVVAAAYLDAQSRAELDALGSSLCGHGAKL